MINVGAFTLLPSQLVVNGPKDILEWEKSARTLLAIQRSVYWWIGDMVVYGEQQFGDDFYQAIDPSASLDLVNSCVAVSREFPPDERNHNLSWSHHRALLALNKPMRQAMLAKAETMNWNSKELSGYVSRIRKVNE